MIHRKILSSVLFIIPIVGISCTPSVPPSEKPATAQTPAMEELLPNGEPKEVTVQHCLIAFQGSLGDEPVRRTKEEAEKLAKDLMKMLEAGDKFDEIVRQFTDDSAPGIYAMANHGVTPDPTRSVSPRGGMVQAFGDVGFKLKVGEYGLAEYDPEKSKFGWHIIKRLK
jgi:parvulin-like peptidyl-prolyl isomerase